MLPLFFKPLDQTIWCFVDNITRVFSTAAKIVENRTNGEGESSRASTKGGGQSEDGWGVRRPWLGVSGLEFFNFYAMLIEGITEFAGGRPQ